MPLLNRVDRAWLEVDGVALAVYPLPQSLSLGEETLTMGFRRSPEIGAIAEGRRFKLSDGPRFVGMFEAQIRSGGGSLIPEKQGYSINTEDLETADLTAYYLPTPESRQSVAVEIVPTGSAKGGNKIAIAPNGTVEASPSLESKTVKVRCVYAHAIVLLDEKIESLVVHMVGEKEEDSFYYGKAPVEVVVGKPKLLKLRFLEQPELKFVC